MIPILSSLIAAVVSLDLWVDKLTIIGSGNDLVDV